MQRGSGDGRRGCPRRQAGWGAAAGGQVEAAAARWGTDMTRSDRLKGNWIKSSVFYNQTLIIHGIQSSRNF